MAILFFGGYDRGSKCDPGYEVRAWVMYGGFFVHLCLHYVCRACTVALWPSYDEIELTETSKQQGWRKQSFARHAAINFHGTLVHAVISPLALYVSWRMATSTPASHSVVLPQSAGFPGMDVGATYDFDVELACQLMSDGAMVGTIFGSWALFQMFMWMVGWEKGWVTLLHHTLFLSLSILCQYVWGHGELTAFAVSMELSSPALDLMLVFRAVKGWEAAADAFGAVFALTFLLCRPLLFGFGLWRSLSFWTRPPPQAEHVEPPKMLLLKIIHVVYLLGWILQLVWAVGIVKKLRRKVGVLLGGKKKSA